MAPTVEDLGIVDAAIIASGAPGRSVLIQRMIHRGEYGMPPLGSAEPDWVAIERIESWVEALSGCL